MADALARLLLDVKTLAVNIWRVFEPIRTWLYLTAAAIGVLTLFVLVRHAQPPTHVTLLTAPRGGSAERLGYILEKRLERPEIWEPQKRRFELVSKETQGFAYNRQQVETDYTGTLIAMGHDGFASADNVRILLPLESSYLHVVVNRSQCEKALGDLRRELHACADASDRTPATTVTTLGELAPLLRSPFAAEKVFFGRDLSGTREVAEFVLKHYDIPVEHVDCKQEYNWKQMRRALLDGNIWLGFHVAPLGFPPLREIASSGGCGLLGIDDAEGMRTLAPHLGIGTVSRHAYGLSRNGGRPFCEQTLQTVTARQVVLCSRYMSASNAYWLATQIKNAIREEMPAIEWESPLRPDPTQPRGFVYLLHPGTRALKDETTHWYHFVPSWLWQPIFVIMVMFGAAAVKRFNDKIANRTAAPSPALNVPNGQRQLEQDVEAFLDDLRQAGRGANWRTLQRRLREWERTLAQARMREEIDDHTYESLWTGLREAAVTIEQSRSTQQVTPSASRVRAKR